MLNSSQKRTKQNTSKQLLSKGQKSKKHTSKQLLSKGQKSKKHTKREKIKTKQLKGGDGSKFEDVVKVYPEFLNDLKKRVIQHILGFDDEKKNPTKEAESLSWINKHEKRVAAAKQVRENNPGYAAAIELIKENESHEDQVWHSMGRIDRISFEQFFESSTIEQSPFDDIIEYLLNKKSLKLDVYEYDKVYKAIEDIEIERHVFSEAQETADNNFRRLLVEIHRSDKV